MTNHAENLTPEDALKELSIQQMVVSIRRDIAQAGRDNEQIATLKAQAEKDKKQVKVWDADIVWKRVQFAVVTVLGIATLYVTYMKVGVN